MEYHSIKMQEVNNTLRDYWRLTYKGKFFRDSCFIKQDLTLTRLLLSLKQMMKMGKHHPENSTCSESLFVYS